MDRSLGGGRETEGERPVPSSLLGIKACKVHGRVLSTQVFLAIL